jgi:hypothetical protein
VEKILVDVEDALSACGYFYDARGVAIPTAEFAVDAGIDASA